MINLKKLKPDIRYLRDMREVVYDKEWVKTAPDDLDLYYIYRGVEKKDGLRYDITIIPPRMLGQEFIKTKGHNHPVEEKYIIVEGEAIFLLQKTNKDIVEDVYAVKLKKGDEITIPPSLGHVVINSSNQELKLANWISEDCKNIYDLFEKMSGACYFYTKRGWIANENYKNIPELKFEKTP